MSMMSGSMGMSGGSQRLVQVLGGMVIYLVIAIVAFQLFPRIQSANDTYLLMYYPRCEDSTAGTRFVRLFIADPDVDAEAPVEDVSLQLTKANCAAGVGINRATTAASEPSITLTADLEDDWILIDEHGNERGAISEGSGTIDSEKILYLGESALATGWYSDVFNSPKWEEPLGVTDRFGGISRTILRILPLVSAAHFLTIGAANMLTQQGRGMGEMVMRITESIIGFVILVVLVNFAPELLEWLDRMYSWAQPGRLTIFEGVWGNLTRLFITFVPLLFNISLLGILGATGIAAYQRVSPYIGRARQAYRSYRGGGRRRRMA